MSDEKLRTRLQDLHDAARSVVIPPGVDRARRTLRRRRVTRTALASVAVVLVSVAALALPRRAVPPPSLTPTRTPSATPSATPSVAPSSQPPTSPSATPGAPASPTGRGGSTRVGIEPYFLLYGSNLSTVVGQDSDIDIPIGVMTWGTGIAT